MFGLNTKCERQFGNKILRENGINLLELGRIDEVKIFHNFNLLTSVLYELLARRVEVVLEIAIDFYQIACCRDNAGTA